MKLPKGGWARGFAGARPWHRFEYDGRNRLYVSRCRMSRILPGIETFGRGAFRRAAGRPICVRCRDGVPLRRREAKREAAPVRIRYGEFMSGWLASTRQEGIYAPKPVSSMPSTTARERK